jgi:hypothetical protein
MERVEAAFVAVRELAIDDCRAGGHARRERPWLMRALCNTAMQWVLSAGSLSGISPPRRGAE